MTSAFRRDVLPQTILSILPFTLFFPIGIIYTWIFVFFLAWCASGQFRTKWETVRTNPMFVPVATLSAVFFALAAYFGKRSDEFWPSLGHFQIYLFLLLFVSVGQGEWQRWAKRAFFIGAMYGASVFYLVRLGVLPLQQPFTSYAYVNGKSIMLCILLALAAGWMLYEWLTETQTRMRWIRGAGLLFVCGALIFVAKARTAHVLFLLLAAGILLSNIKLSWKKTLPWLVATVVLLALVWHYSTGLRARAMETIQDAQSYSQGNNATSTGIRLDLYQITWQMIREKPVLGHGIGMWLPTFQQRSIGLPANEMLTPHNEYLLHAAEAGIVGLGALLFVWFSQLWIAYRVRGYQGAVLGLLGTSIMVGAMFNAILRDAVYGMPFIVLLAIPLAGLRSNMLTKKA